MKRIRVIPMIALTERGRRPELSFSADWPLIRLAVEEEYAKRHDGAIPQKRARTFARLREEIAEAEKTLAKPRSIRRLEGYLMGVVSIAEWLWDAVAFLKKKEERSAADLGKISVDFVPCAVIRGRGVHYNRVVVAFSREAALRAIEGLAHANEQESSTFARSVVEKTVLPFPDEEVDLDRQMAACLDQARRPHR